MSYMPYKAVNIQYIAIKFENVVYRPNMNLCTKYRLLNFHYLLLLFPMPKHIIYTIITSRGWIRRRRFNKEFNQASSFAGVAFASFLSILIALFINSYFPKYAYKNKMVRNKMMIVLLL